MSVVPVFRDNVETSSILASPQIHVLEEIPDTQKAYVSTKATIANEISASFQNPNLNQWIQGEIELVFQRTFEFRGKTQIPSTNQAEAGTGPFLWNPMNSTFDGFALNKLISEIKFSVANKQFTEVDRQNPEMIDMFALQFDQEVIKSYGIYGEDGLKNSVNNQQNFVNGSDVIRPSDLAGMGNFFPALACDGWKTGYQNPYSRTLQPWQQNSKGYVKVVSNEYAYLSAPNTKLTTSTRVDGFEGIAVPTSDGQNGIVVEYSVDAAATRDETLVQTVVLEIHEFIISPNLSNPYSKNPHKKIYYSGGYPFNLSLTFNQDYAKSMFKWTPSTRHATVVPSLYSSLWTSAEMRFWTFDSSKPLPTEPIKTLYYKQELQTPVPRSFVPTSTGAKDSISTSNLSSLPYYIFVYAIARPSATPAWFTDRKTNPYSELLPIKSVNLRLGTQADALASMDMYKEELVRHTLMTLGNNDLRDLISSEAMVLECGDIGQLNNVAFGTPPTPSQIQGAQPSFGDKRGFPFYILDVAKLNLRTLDGLPILPGVNYGSTSFKSLTITVEYEGTHEMVISTGVFSSNVPLNAELNVVLMNKRIRTLPLLSGNMTDDPVEFNINDVSAELMQQISSGYSGNGDNQLAYVGGSFLGSIWETVKGYLKHPTLKSIARLARKVRDETADEESDILRGVHKVSSGLAKVADFAGLGRKSKYSRV